MERPGVAALDPPAPPWVRFPGVLEAFPGVLEGFVLPPGGFVDAFAGIELPLLGRQREKEGGEQLPSRGAEKDKKRSKGR